MNPTFVPHGEILFLWYQVLELDEEAHFCLESERNGGWETRHLLQFKAYARFEVPEQNDAYSALSSFL